MTDLTQHAIFRLPKFGRGPGLHRVGALIGALELDAYLDGTARIAVTGSNGKGSTARLTAQILTEAGVRTGLFTSPHLYRFNERIMVDGVPVEDALLAAEADGAMASILAYEAANPGDRVGAFEAFFVLALLAFRRLGAEALVLEAGIGGRLDAVRMARAAIATVVTVDLEHTEILGSSLEGIALDKLDIVAEDGEVVLGAALAPYRPAIEAHAGRRGITPVFIGDIAGMASKVRTETGRCIFLKVEDLEIPDIELALRGAHQVHNLAIAVALARRALEHLGRDDHALAEAVRRAARNVTWPGRLELISENPRITIDVGHTPEAVARALAAFRALEWRPDSLLVTGSSRDKAAAKMAGLLAPAFGHILCTSARHKGAPAEEIAAAARAANPDAVVMIAPTIAEAVRQVRAYCEARRTSALVAGGLFVSIEFAEAFRGGDPDRLIFF
ncbi:MAG: Mur ligase family protein [Hyphomicrobiaceae bacterium]